MRPLHPPSTTRSLTRVTRRTRNLERRLTAADMPTLPADAISIPIDVLATGNTTLVAADATHKIEVYQVLLMAADIVVVTFKSDTTAVTGPIPLLPSTGFTLPLGLWFKTATNKALKINCDDTVQVSGVLVYHLIT